jgi:hypothetical protein
MSRPVHASPPARTSLPRSTFGWLGLLTGPMAWAIQLFTSWGLAEVVACAPANRPTGIILGLEVNAFVGIVNAVLLALTLLAGVGSYVELRRVRGRPDATPGERATWLAGAGVMTSVLFVVVIAVSFVPVGSIGPCQEAL